MHFAVSSFLFLVFVINAYAGETSQALPLENSFYAQASAKLVVIPKEYNKVMSDMLKNGWKEDKNIVKLINDNSASLELFKKATLEKSDGYVFGRSLDKFTMSSKLPDYVKYVQLFKLLLLEGKLSETKGLYKKAQEDYLAAIRFMIHVSQQKYGIMISSIISYSFLDLAYLYLEESFRNDAPYRNNLLNNLKELKDSQDFLEGAFKEEGEGLKNTARILEDDARKGATFEGLFQISAVDNSDKEQISKYQERSKELTDMLYGEFFTEFYKQIDPQIDAFTLAAISAAKENNSAIYENKIKDFQDSVNKLGTPLNYLLWSLDKAVAEGKNPKLIVADTMANIFLTLAIPNFSKTIEKYWSFYNKLNVLIDKVAEKNINKE